MRTLSSKEEAARKRIGDLRQRLLDLGNSNRLLNYKFSNRTRRQIRLVDELPNGLLRKLLEGKRLIFKALPEVSDQSADEKSDQFLLAFEQAKRSDEEYLAALKNLNEEDDEASRRIDRALRDRLRKTLGMPDHRLLDQTSRAEWARRNDIEPGFDLPLAKNPPKPSHLDDDIQTLLLPEEMERTLSGINDQARIALQEKGVNTLYLALGYLEWYETPTSQARMYAPLLLHPVDIERKLHRGRYRYSIGSLGDEMEVNLTLSERLHQDFHRRLPPLDEDDTPERYFRKVREAIEGIPGWQVRRFAVLGHFAFARLVMFQDLEESRWPGGVGIVENPVIAELFAGTGTMADTFFAEDYEVDEPAIAAKVPLLITDADSSQFSAIVDVMDGKNLAIKGPPGTGKSQTITNIIAAALARYQTVLFVAEKMAALNVVKDRLEKAGLGYFCLELHSTKARKKDLLESLDRRRKIQKQLSADGDLAAATKELKRAHALLSDYVATINHTFGASGKTIHQIIWSEQRTRTARDALPKALESIDLIGAKEMTRHDVTALKDKLKVLADAYAEAAGTDGLDRNPWSGVVDATLDYFGRERVLSDVEVLRDALRQIASALAAIEERLRIQLTRTFTEALKLNEGFAHLPGPAHGVDFEIYAMLHDPDARKALEALQTDQAAWLEAGSKLIKWTNDPNLLTKNHSKLDELASLASELGVDVPLGKLSEQATALRAEADKLEQAIVHIRQLATAFVIDVPLTAVIARKVVSDARKALEALQTDQAAWLEAGKKLIGWANDPNLLTKNHSELDGLASLTSELGVDVPLGKLSEQATALRAEADKLEQAIVHIRQLATAFVIDVPLTAVIARKLLAGAKYASALPSNLLPLRHPGLFDEQTSAILRQAQKRAQTLTEKIAQLAERLMVTLNGRAEEWRRHAQVLRSARFPFAFLRRDVKTAKARWRDMQRKPLKGKRHHMAADFEELAECIEVAASFTADASLQMVCGPHFRGYETEFDGLLQVNSYVLDVKRTFSSNDVINERVRRRLLEGSIDALSQLVSLACDPQSVSTEAIIASMSDAEVDLDAHHRGLSARARQIAELGRRALALGLKPDLPIRAISDVARVVVARLQTEGRIETNSAARALLGAQWQGAESDPSLVVNILHSVSEVSTGTEAIIASISNVEVDLIAHHRGLSARAQQIAELGQRALALGLKPDLPAHVIPDVARVVTARLQTEGRIEANSMARALLNTRWHGAESDRSLIVNALHAASEVENAMLPEPIRCYLYDTDRDRHISDLRLVGAQLNGAIEAALEAWRRARADGKIDEAVFFGAALEKTSVASARIRLDRALEAPDQLTVWVRYLAAREECAACGLIGILDAFAGQPLNASKLLDALDRVFWRTLSRAALLEFPALSGFHGLQLERARERFRHLDNELIALQRKALAADLCHRPIYPGRKGERRKDDTGLILVGREISKQRRHIPIRELLDRAGDSIQQMKPCFMMSPLSVAQFLKPDGLRFDLVVIDEASQMRPEEALGAIARGGQLVVVGDPMQLPPTSFFERVDRIEDEDIGEEEIEDRESILDLALAEFRPSRNLRWHYRSRHESLIAFSNRHFYDDLIIFPSPLDPDRQKRQPKLGVYHHFVGGTYKGRINIEEARKVAEAAVEFMAAEPSKSLGIVTLNQPQSEILRDEIERLVARDGAAQRYIELWEDTLEPFFVKNLENVQGDERDVIFISTVYGPDATTGVVLNRLGPINGIHGHRRLNVLFTRAKDRVEVFTSMKPNDIKSDQDSKRGVHVLKAYLEYAESGQLESGAISGREPDSEFEELVRDRLREKGYEVISQVGVAGYFIDLAVKHPERSGFILGIECDGASYHSSRSARDRDRLRQLVLEGLHWNIYRIWSTDWFHNPQGELRRLLNHLERLLRDEVFV